MIKFIINIINSKLVNLKTYKQMKFIAPILLLIILILSDKIQYTNAIDWQ